jgi:hypothetical protein
VFLTWVRLLIWSRNIWHFQQVPSRFPLQSLVLNPSTRGFPLHSGLKSYILLLSHHDDSAFYDKKQMTLTHQQFIKRFSLHILPKRFVKIRHYGFLSSTWKLQKLNLLQEKLQVKVLGKVEKKPFLPKCPCCKTGNLHRIAVFDQRGPPAWYLGGSQNSILCKS